MSLFSEQKSQLGLFIADFDQTCNTRDTTELYYRASQRYQNASPEEREIIDKKWNQVTRKYLREYREQIAASLSKFEVTTSSEFDEEGLHSFLSEIAAFNRAAAKDVVDSKLITGVDRIGLQWAAKQVKFYPGCFDVLKSALPHVRIVSVNWSSEMIGYSFNEMIPSDHIYANKLLDNNGLSSGLIGKEFISSFDKLKLVKNLIESGGDKEKVTIFVGDSITDVPSMLEVHLGIIIGDSTTLLRVAKLFGIKVLPLSSLLEQTDLAIKCKDSKVKTLYSAEDWYQIQKLLKRFNV